MKKIILFLTILLLVILYSCTEPMTGQLVKDGGKWNIESLNYKIINPDKTEWDTTFTNCGEVDFVRFQNTENVKESDWTVEGHIIEPCRVYINNVEKYIWSTYYFWGTSRTFFLQIGSAMNIWNYQYEKFTVTKNTGDYMEWEHINWDGNRIWYYKLKKQ